MRETGYLPAKKLRERSAPTEGPLRGVVHDPTARGMEGVAGHAGVFSTAADLARYARMLVNEGTLDGVRVLQTETVRRMTSLATPDSLEARRSLGWDIDTGYSRRGKVFPIGSYGHTGFTGTMLWIDPFSKTFVIFLSNRVHPTATATSALSGPPSALSPPKPSSGRLRPRRRRFAARPARPKANLPTRNSPGRPLTASTSSRRTSLPNSAACAWA